MADHSKVAIYTDGMGTYQARCLGCTWVGCWWREQERTHPEAKVHSLTGASTVTVKVGSVFYDDHVYRDLNGGVEVSRNKRTVTVVLDAEAYNELLSDAKYYADNMADGGYMDRSVIQSARGVVGALEKVGCPS